MSRAVRLNPLTVLVSVLIAAEVGGLVGALLAIPASGIAGGSPPAGLQDGPLRSR